MTRILLIGHFGFTNLGNEAIVRSTVDIIRGIVPQARITLVSRTAANDRAICKSKGILVDEIVASGGPYARFSPLWTMHAVSRRLFRRGVSHHDYTHEGLYRTHDAVLSVGGDMLSDDFRGIARSCFQSLVHAKAVGAKTVIWGASIGPFKDPAQARKWASILSSVDLITAREDMTVEYLRSVGVFTNVRRVADPAFVLRPEKPAQPFSGRTSGKTLVGIGVSDLLAKSNEHGDQYVKAFSEFVRHLVSERKCVVCLIAHVNDGGPTTDDRAACQTVLKLAGCEGCVKVVGPGYDSAEMKYIIGQCDVFIGARTHSTIASLSMLVPTISIAYSVKAHGINRSIFDTEEFVLNASQISCPDLIRVFETLQSKREFVVSRLESKMPLIRSMALRSGDFLMSTLKN